MRAVRRSISDFRQRGDALVARSKEARARRRRRAAGTTDASDLVTVALMRARALDLTDRLYITGVSGKV